MALRGMCDCAVAFMEHHLESRYITMCNLRVQPYRSNLIEAYEQPCV